MLAKKNTGMNAIMAMPRMMFSTRNGRLSKIRTLISGWAVRRSTRENTTSSTTPTAMHTSMAGLPQPHSWRLLEAEHAQPTPPMIRARPR